MDNPMDSLEELKLNLRSFAHERDWEQYHSPKNLVMALSGEVGELVEHFQWLTAEESEALSEEKLQAVAEEIADVQLYLIRLADRLNVDILTASRRKIQLNALKYPVNKCKGLKQKYTDL